MNATPPPTTDERPAASEPHRSRRFPIAAGLVLLAAILGTGLWLAYRRGPDLVQAMADTDNINVSAKITARVAKLLVREGDRVAPGQLLFELDSPEVAAKQRQAAAALDGALAQQSKATEGARQEQIRAAQANWRRAEAAGELARSTYLRTKALFTQGVVTRQRYEEAQAQSLSAAQVTAAARAQYDEALTGTRRQDRQAALAGVRQAEGAVAEVQASRDEVNGRAPTAAEVSKRLAEVGELVPAGYPVFTLVDINRMWVAFNLREDQFKGVRIGRVLRGDVPALGLKSVPFEVYFINPAGDFATWRATRQSSGFDVKSFEVRARPVHPVADFRPGMSVLFEWPQG